MAAVKDLEKSLDDIFVNKAPVLPISAKKLIVQYLPWLNLAAGIIALLAALGLWHAIRYTDQLVDTANRLSNLYGVPTTVSHVSFTAWLALIILAIEGVIYIAAFQATRLRQKKGWDLLFYALLINVVYGLALGFSSNGDIGNLIGSVIGTAIGLYFLFQIRGEYLGTKTVVAAKAEKAVKTKTVKTEK